MTAVDMAKLNRPGVMSSYSSSGRKNTVHGSKSTVVGSTFNQARMTAATKFLSPSKGGHVSARIMAENSAPRYLSGSETAIIANRDSGQVTSLQSGTSIFGFSARMMMPSMPMGGMSTGGVLGFLAGTAGAAILNKVLSPGAQAQSASQQLDTAITTGGNFGHTTTNAEIATMISDMQGCSTSAELGEALQSAKGQLTSMSGQLESFKAEAKTAQATKDNLTSQKGIAEKQKQDATQTVRTHQNTVKTLTDSRNNALEAAKTGNTAYDEATKKYAEAHDAHIDASNAKKLADKDVSVKAGQYTKAQQATQAAEANYNNLNSQYMSCTDSAQKAAIKTKLDIAKHQLEQAKVAEENAKLAKEAAEKAAGEAADKETSAAANEQAAKTAKDTAYSNLGDLKAKADQAGKALESEQKRLDEYKDKLEAAEEGLKDIEVKVDDFDTQIKGQDGIIELAQKFDNDKKSLEEEIKNQEKRMKEMQKNEEKQAKLEAKQKENETKT